jgi:hypothetical protein
LIARGKSKAFWELYDVCPVGAAGDGSRRRGKQDDSKEDELKY